MTCAAASILRPVQKLVTTESAGVADLRCGYSVGYGDTIDTLALTQFVVYRNIWRTYDSVLNSKYFEEGHYVH